MIYIHEKHIIIEAALSILRMDNNINPGLKSQASEYLKLVIRKAHDEEVVSVYEKEV